MSLRLRDLRPFPSAQEACTLLWSLMRLQPRPTAGKRAASPRYTATAGPGSPLPLLLPILLEGLRRDADGSSRQLSPHDLACAFWAVGVAAAVKPGTAVRAFRDGSMLVESRSGSVGSDEDEDGADGAHLSEAAAGGSPLSSLGSPKPSSSGNPSVWDLVPALVPLLSRVAPSDFHAEDLARIHHADLLLRAARKEADRERANSLSLPSQHPQMRGGWHQLNSSEGESSRARESAGRHPNVGFGADTPLASASDAAKESRPVCSPEAGMLGGEDAGDGYVGLSNYGAGANVSTMALNDCYGPNAADAMIPDSGRSAYDDGADAALLGTAGSGGAGSPLGRFGRVLMIQGREVVDVSHFSTPNAECGDLQGSEGDAAVPLPWWKDVGLSVLPAPLAEAAAAGARTAAAERYGTARSTSPSRPFAAGASWRHEVLTVSVDIGGYGFRHGFAPTCGLFLQRAYFHVKS